MHSTLKYTKLYDDTSLLAACFCVSTQVCSKTRIHVALWHICSCKYDLAASWFSLLCSKLYSASNRINIYCVFRLFWYFFSAFVTDTFDLILFGIEIQQKNPSYNGSIHFMFLFLDAPVGIDVVGWLYQWWYWPLVNSSVFFSKLTLFFFLS